MANFIQNEGVSLNFDDSEGVAIGFESDSLINPPLYDWCDSKGWCESWFWCKIMKNTGNNYYISTNFIDNNG